MIISISDCWEDVKNAHFSFFDSYVKPKLLQEKDNLPFNLFNFLHTNHNNIKSGNQDQHKTLIKTYLELNATENEIKILQRIYSYDYLSNKKSSWNAYNLTSNAKIKTCPYCNLSYAHTIFRDSAGKVRPSLDHFFDKARYPFLAISLYNLIPSCHNCNSSLKGSIDFYTKPHLNPLTDSECIVIRLSEPIQEILTNLSLIDDVKIVIKPVTKKEKNSVDTFLLDKRYEQFEPEAKELIRNLLQIDEFSRNYDIDASILRKLVLSSIDKSNYKDKVLGKLTMDILNYSQGF